VCVCFCVVLSTNKEEEYCPGTLKNTLDLLSLHQCGREPVKTFVQTITGGSTASLNVPLAVTRTKSVQTKFISHFGSTHSIREILLVGKDEKDGIAQFVLVEHSVHFIASGIDTVSIIGIHHEDQSLGVLVVVAPQRTDLVLTSDIPNCKGNVLVFDSFDVESNGRNGGNN
jgi:hypothetical protein